MEFAHMAARAGSKVTIIDYGDRPLKAFDADLANRLIEVSKTLGIKFIFKAEAKNIERKGKKYIVSYYIGKKKKSMKVDSVFNTTGRVPAIEKLELDKGNVSHSDEGIEVNSYLRSKTNNSVYACGDVSDNSVPLSPLSGYEAYIVAKNIIRSNKTKIDIPLVPSVVFTLPHLASVGYSEEEAKSRYKNVVVNYKEVPDWYNNKRINGTAYAFKIIINERTDLIVGVHLLSSEAAETINLFVMAMNLKIKCSELKRMIFTYPSWSYDIKSML